MLGYLATAAISAVEGAVVVGGLSAVGVAIDSIGIPKYSVMQHETATYQCKRSNWVAGFVDCLNR
ncbi:hypothetical protein [Rhodopila sp.]|uniref:hypothetical protein n=1 Tax=Rhodopila sp. TaxID=2480087 RepID=UPI003D0E2EE7